MFRVNPEHTGVIPAIETPSGELLWNYSSGFYVFSSPAVLDGNVYTGNSNKQVFAFDALNGEKLWNVTAGGSVWSSPAVHEGKVWIGSDNQFYVLDAATGSQLWSQAGTYPGSATISDGTAYFGNSEGFLYAVDEDTRDVIWSVDTDMAVQSTPAVDVDTIYVEGLTPGGSRLKAFDRSNGTQKWDTGIAGPTSWLYWIPQSSPALANGLVYIGSSWDESLYAIYPGNGTIRWEYDSGGYVFSSPAVEGDAVYFADLDGHVRRLDAITGVESWNTTLPGPVFSSPTIIGDSIYVGCDDGTVYAIDKDSGDEMGVFNAGSEVRTDIVYEDAVIYFGSYQGDVIAVGTLEAPASVTDLHNTTYLPASITWTWTDPASEDLDHVMVFVNGTFQENVTKGMQEFTAIDLDPSTPYTISTHTAGVNGMVNETWVNQTAVTAACVPQSITNLRNTTFLSNSITWSWENPDDACFEGVMVYLDGQFVTNRSSALEFIITWNLDPDTNYTLSTRSLGTDGSINQTWVNYTARTAPSIPPSANFTANQTSGFSPLTVQFTSTSTGTPPLSYRWTFGDGGDAMDSDPVHTYTASTNTTYTVTLNVSNSAGWSTMSIPITVNVTPVPPVANFTANVTSGLSPLAVQFTSTSTGTEPLTYDWEFGDGWMTAMKDPVHIFTATTNTTYTVLLTVTNSAGSDSKVMPITVNVTPEPPVANFTVNQTQGLSPLTVQFTNTSTGTQPFTYFWGFGDGSNSSSTNPVHTFIAIANTTYDVTLNVTNSAGADTKTIPITVNVSPVVPPVANFTANQTSGFTPLAVQFTSTSTGSGPLTYMWTFGDGSNATSQNPVHTFTAVTNTTYTVTLNVTNSAGSSVMTMPITVNVNPLVPPVADFTANQTFGISPLTVQFNSTSTGSAPLAYLWTFGDGGSATSQNPSHTFNATANATYTVTLNVTNSAGSSTKTMPITVNVTMTPPVANFMANQTAGMSPLTVQFISTSTGTPPLTYLWDFGDGNNATSQNPVHIFTAITNTTYTVTLNVTNSAGSSTKTMPITVNVTPVLPPVANFTANQTTGMSPLVVRFTSTSTGTPPLTYLWDFGDGSSATSPDPVHTFTSTANTTFTVTLNVTNRAGSSMKTMPITVNVTPVLPPVANFTANQTTGISPLVVRFTSTSTGTPPLTYLWDFGDGSNATSQDPAHTFTASTDTTYTVTLNVSNSAGWSTMSIPVTVTVVPGKTGSVYVYTTPSNASIYIDGLFRGTTNQLVSDVPAGLRNLTLTKPGFQTKILFIEVPAGDVKVLPPITLQPGGPSIDKGSLYVYSSPSNATISIDGIVSGTTNQLVSNVTAGTRNLTLTKPGFRPRTLLVDVPAGDLKVLAPINLEPVR